VTLHAGVGLALEKNVVAVIYAKVEKLDNFSFPQDRGGYDYFLLRTVQPFPGSSATGSGFAR
jgi:hypothetical protein